MLLKKEINHCIITKVSFFSESSASLNILLDSGLHRVIALSFTKKYNYDLSDLYCSSYVINITESASSLYLSQLNKIKTYDIPQHRLYLLLFIRSLVDYFSEQHFSSKIYLGYIRFLELLSDHDDEEYYYYALASYQLLLLDISGLGSASLQLRSLFADDLLTLEEIKDFHYKRLSFQSFLKIQSTIDKLFEQQLGYIRPKDYFSLWLKVIT